MSCDRISHRRTEPQPGHICARQFASRSRTAVVFGQHGGSAGRGAGQRRARFPRFPIASGNKGARDQTLGQAATRDRSQIRAWWRRRPAAKGALGSGPAGGDVVGIGTRPGHAPPPRW
ncbi:bifunctional DNA primase/polymerase, partial [Nocardia abscessus]|uniref:bifunctional DNA primase/polymerase n=1 Tax=Nocardia abscessus TaxID=120957 RepID=UPI003CC80EBB